MAAPAGWRGADATTRVPCVGEQIAFETTTFIVDRVIHYQLSDQVDFDAMVTGYWQQTYEYAEDEEYESGTYY